MSVQGGTAAGGGLRDPISAAGEPSSTPASAAATDALVSAAWRSLSMGGVSRADVDAPVHAFFAARDVANADRAAVVARCCTRAGAVRYTDAAARPTETLFDDAAAALDATSTVTALANKNARLPTDHNAFRYQAYRFLSRRYDYNDVDVPQRIPLPMLVELLVKAALPGDGPCTWTTFVAIANDGIEADHVRRQAAADAGEDDDDDDAGGADKRARAT